jgi:branched-chain amino acid transport system ATP-binding protein
MNGLTVAENLWLAARRPLGHADVEAAVDEITAELGLEALARRPVGELAHGQRQLVEIGLVLAGKPWLVLLDEPAAGMTSAETERLVAIVQKINRSATVIVVDHDMHFVRMLGGRITVFHQGAILVEGGTETVLADARVREVYLGTRTR